MPRNYKRDRPKSYKTYDKDRILTALKEYKKGKASFVTIAKKYNIPKSVLHRHNKGNIKRQGGQTVLSKDEEEYIIKHLNICSEWGYPLDTYNLRILVKGYLDEIGATTKKFKNNMPGPDYVASFLRRHDNIVSKRIGRNIKRFRAAVSRKVIEAYFDELGKSLENALLCNIVNYDETNFSDDQMMMRKRKVKHPESIMKNFKSSTSLMMAAAADGTLLPCYVVCKSHHPYESWTTQGPKGCMYNRTNSGWFDATTFEDWVRTIALPYFANKPGKKILIGDYLSSHLSICLIRECKEKDIHFMFLPANSTHITQPLDIAFFKSMKSAWRDIIFNGNKSEGKTFCTDQKCNFPSLLKKLMVCLDQNAKENILAGFKKAGISPFNKNEVLERLPGDSSRKDDFFCEETVDSDVIPMSKEMRKGLGDCACNSRKEITVILGRSVCTDDENIEEANMEYVDSKSPNRENEQKLTHVEDDQEQRLEPSTGAIPGPRTDNLSLSNYHTDEVFTTNIDDMEDIVFNQSSISRQYQRKSRNKNETQDKQVFNKSSPLRQYQRKSRTKNETQDKQVFNKTSILRQYQRKSRTKDETQDKQVFNKTSILRQYHRKIRTINETQDK